MSEKLNVSLTTHERRRCFITSGLERSDNPGIRNERKFSNPERVSPGRNPFRVK
jgi:hypothetical protein